MVIFRSKYYIILIHKSWSYILKSETTCRDGGKFDNSVRTQPKASWTIMVSAIFTTENTLFVIIDYTIIYLYLYIWLYLYLYTSRLDAAEVDDGIHGKC